MHKATLGLGLQSEREDWFTSSSDAATLTKEWMREIAHWVFEEGCRRLGVGGWGPERGITFSVIAHTNLTRVNDETCEVKTRFYIDQTRVLMRHLFDEAWIMLLGEKHDDGNRAG